MDSSDLLVEGLTRREKEILDLLSQNLTNQEIAERLVLSLHSVKWYARQIYGKLGVANRQEAVAKACAFGLLGGKTLAKKKIHNLPRPLS
jgi:LuxR family maltose regulon positive regulatory protein